jgi:hypothetical protein
LSYTKNIRFLCKSTEHKRDLNQINWPLVILLQREVTCIWLQQNETQTQIVANWWSDAFLMARINLCDNFASGPKVRIQWWTDAFAQVHSLTFLRAIDATAHSFYKTVLPLYYGNTMCSFIWNDDRKGIFRSRKPLKPLLIVAGSRWHRRQSTGTMIERSWVRIPSHLELAFVCFCKVHYWWPR